MMNIRVLIMVAAAVWLQAVGYGAEPDDAASAPPQAYLLPLDVEKIQNTALEELLKLRPELKAEDLKVDGLMYILRPDPDYALQEQKDGSQKKVYLSNNYQQLDVTFIILHSGHDGEERGRHTVVHDTVSVNFPNARTNKFSVSKGTSTEYR